MIHGDVRVKRSAVMQGEIGEVLPVPEIRGKDDGPVKSRRNHTHRAIPETDFRTDISGTAPVDDRLNIYICSHFWADIGKQIHILQLGIFLFRRGKIQQLPLTG